MDSRRTYQIRCTTQATRIFQGHTASPGVIAGDPICKYRHARTRAYGYAAAEAQGELCDQCAEMTGHATKRIATLQRRWAADAMRDAHYNAERAKHVRSPQLKAMYQQEERWDLFWARRRLRIANRYSE